MSILAIDFEIDASVIAEVGQAVFSYGVIEKKGFFIGDEHL